MQLNKKNRMFSQMRKTRAPKVSTKIDTLKAEVERKLNEAKLGYMSPADPKLKDNPKEFWKFVISNKTDDTGVPPNILD